MPMYVCKGKGSVYGFYCFMNRYSLVKNITDLRFREWESLLTLIIKSCWEILTQ